MKKYNIEVVNDKASYEILIKSSENASPSQVKKSKLSKLSKSSGDSDGVARRFVVSSDFTSSPCFACVPQMSGSSYVTFFGVGGQYLSSEGRELYDERVFAVGCQNYFDEMFSGGYLPEARLSNTSLSDNFKAPVRRGNTASNAVDASAKSAKIRALADSLNRRPAPCAERAILYDSRIKRSVCYDNNDSNDDILERYERLKNRFEGQNCFRPYPIGYQFEYSTANGGNSDKLVFDDNGKFALNLSESARLSCPSIKPFFNGYDMIKNPNSGSFCGFDGGCRVSLFGFWSDFSAVEALFTEVGEVKEFVDVMNLKCASMQVFEELKAWKVSFNPGRGQMFGRNVRLPFCLSYGGIEIFFNVDVEQQTFDFSDDGTGADVVLGNCMTSEGRDRLRALYPDADLHQKLNEHFRELSGFQSCVGAFVPPCGGSKRSARVAIGVNVGAQVFRELGMSFPEAGRLVKRVLASIGFVTTDETVGRVDFGFITDRFSVQQLRAWDMKDENGKNIDYRYVCPAGRPSYSGTTLQFGRRGGQAALRVYDKWRELNAHVTSDGGDKLRYFYDTLGDEYVADSVINNKPLTRVEWEISREGLQNMRLPDGSVSAVRTLDDLEKALPSIIKYFCKDWFRITEKNILKGHSSIAKTWDVWEEVSDACVQFASWLSGDENKEVPKLLRVTKTYEKLPDEECAANKVAQGFGRYLVATGHLDFNRDISEDELDRLALSYFKRYKKQVLRSWRREGSELIDRQRIFESRAVPTGEPYQVDVSKIPDLIYDYNDMEAGGGVSDDR